MVQLIFLTITKLFSLYEKYPGAFQMLKAIDL